MYVSEVRIEDVMVRGRRYMQGEALPVGVEIDVEARIDGVGLELGAVATAVGDALRELVAEEEDGGDEDPADGDDPVATLERCVYHRIGEDEDYFDEAMGAISEIRRRLRKLEIDAERQKVIDEIESIRREVWALLNCSDPEYEIEEWMELDYLSSRFLPRLHDALRRAILELGGEIPDR